MNPLLDEDAQWIGPIFFIDGFCQWEVDWGGGRIPFIANAFIGTSFFGALLVGVEHQHRKWKHYFPTLEFFFYFFVYDQIHQQNGLPNVL